MPEKLAIHGGTKAVPDGLMKPWPPVDDVDRRMVMASLDGHEHTYGPNCRALEEEFAHWNGIRHVCTCNSGTAAIHMCLAACGCGVGDEVLVPAYTWPSSASACLHHNCIPVFVDIDWETMNLDIAKIEAALTPRTRAIVAVHLHGLTLDMDALMALARQHDLFVIEDACQSVGATFKGRKAGTFGHVGAFSTNQNKVLSSGEGGFFTSDDPDLFAKGKTLWYFGENRAPDESPQYHTYGLGWMYRNNDLVAAFARVQLTKLDHYLATQKANAARLTERLKGVPHLILPTEPEGYGHTYYNYTIRFDLEALGRAADAKTFRDKIVAALRAEGADVGIWQGWPVPQMTVFQARNAYGKGCPWSCQYAGNVSYDLAQFPVAKRHSDWHVGMTTPLRAPNGTEVADAVAAAFGKVMGNLDQVEKVKGNG